MSNNEGAKETAESSPAVASRLRVFRYLKGIGGVSLILLLIIWVGPSLLSEESGVSFGLIYQGFFSVIVLIGAAFFWLLSRDRIPHPRSTSGVLGSVALVYLGTVGILIAVGIVLPQFEGAPTAPKAPGEALFWSNNPGCFLCHTIDGSGGTRAPDLTDVASRAGQRVPDLSANEYLREKIKAGRNFRYTVPEYSPIMPEFQDSLTDEEIDDLVAYLLGPR